MASRRYEVVAGPSLMDLSIALFDRENPRRRVMMSVKIPELETVDVVPIIVNALEREDGSGDNWNFRGYMPPRRNGDRSTKIKGFFCVKTRKGYLDVELEK